MPGGGARRKHPSPAFLTFPHVALAVKDSQCEVAQVPTETGRKKDMSDTTLVKVTPGTRAVQRRIDPGSMTLCAHCDEQVKFAAKLNRMQVIANVYVDGRWDRVEHFHEECYMLAGDPHGQPAEAVVRNGSRAR